MIFSIFDDDGGLAGDGRRAEPRVCFCDDNNRAWCCERVGSQVVCRIQPHIGCGGPGMERRAVPAYDRLGAPRFQMCIGGEAYSCFNHNGTVWCDIRLPGRDGFCGAGTYVLTMPG